MNEPWHLLDAYFEGEITPAEEQSLTTWLTSDAEHFRIFVQEAHLNHRLRHESLAAKSFTAASPIATEPPPAKKKRPHIISFPSPRIPKNLQAPLAMAASIVFLASLFLWLFPRTNNDPALLLTAGTQLTILRGGPNGTEIMPTNKMKLHAGDFLRLTGSNSVTLNYAPESTQIKIQPGAELQLLRTPAKNLALNIGKLEATVARQRPFHPMLVRTPQGEARVLGTKLTLTATTNSTRLDVLEGKVRLTRSSDTAHVEVPAGHYAIAASATELNALPETGSILREIWTGVPGDSINDVLYNPAYPDGPSSRDFLKSFDSNLIETNNLASRVIGYVHPPLTGDYIFSLKSPAEAVLWLSGDDNPANKARFLSIIYFSDDRRYPEERIRKVTHEPQTQKSASVPLLAGRRYFIQLVQKTGSGPNQFSVEWQSPGGEPQIIPGEFLSPYRTKKNQ
jgi:ferric-dicitrate binding protein FerR (iron transport regulator)